MRSPLFFQRQQGPVKIKSPPSILYTISILWLYQIEKNHITHMTYRGIAMLLTILNKSCYTMRHLNHESFPGNQATLKLLYSEPLHFCRW